jgi:hypothetical protein
MNTEEIKRIERELGIELPSHYQTFLSTFEGLNNSEVDIAHMLYSGADHIIEINRLVGFHKNDKMIKNKLIIGDSGGGDVYLIDLVDKSNETVYVFDHEETVENCFDKDKRTFDWDRFDRYDTVDRYRTSIQEMFG